VYNDRLFQSEQSADRPESLPDPLREDTLPSPLVSEFHVFDPLPGLLADLAHGPEAIRREATQQLDNMPAEDLLPRLTYSLNATRDYPTFLAIGSYLAARPEEAAFDALLMQVRTRNELSGAAINIFIQCRHQRLIPSLLEMLETGSWFSRANAASALSRLGTVEAIEPLSRLALDRGNMISQEAHNALHEMGRPDELTRQILRTVSLASTDKMRILSWLGEAARFNVLRFLEREARRTGSDIQQEAQVVAHKLRERLSLVRASETPADSFLRPARNPDTTDGSDKLRPAEAPAQSEEVRGEEGP
jgi:HEAT repeat protein